ncbi:CheR family methyltransferase [Candidatus Poribacteria bacterium]
MNTRTFNAFRTLIYEKSGISLSDGKEPLIYSRVGKRMRALGIDDYRTYLNHIVKDNSGQEVVYLLDAISTNVTSFFRENDHFQFLAKVMKEWNASGLKRLRLWSAACSSGEEPYSMAMTALETISDAYDVKILATDISTRILEKAERGVYEAGKIKQMSRTLAERHFEKISESDGFCYAVKPVLKNMIAFRRLNLSTPPFPMRGPLDIVFCRNVMIYFDNHVRQKLLAEIHRLLKPAGYLMVGHSESLIGLIRGFKAVQPSVYMKTG